MILKTKLSDLSDFLWERKELFEAAGTTVVDEEGVRLEISNYRIQLPGYGIGIRDGFLLSQDVSDPDGAEKEDGDEWEVEDTVALIYDIGEHDPGRYLCWGTDFVEDYTIDYLENNGYEVSDPEEIDCLIDTSEYLDESLAEELLSRSEEANEEADDSSSTGQNEDWDRYLDPKVMKEYRESNRFNTPRERILLDLIVAERPITDAPFTPVEYDKKFFVDHKEEYELMKETNPDKVCFFDYPPDGGDL